MLPASSDASMLVVASLAPLRPTVLVVASCTCQHANLLVPGQIVSGLVTSLYDPSSASSGVEAPLGARHLMPTTHISRASACRWLQPDAIVNHSAWHARLLVDGLAHGLYVPWSPPHRLGPTVHGGWRHRFPNLRRRRATWALHGPAFLAAWPHLLSSS
jgi:hypothetical protein